MIGCCQKSRQHENVNVEGNTPEKYQKVAISGRRCPASNHESSENGCIVVPELSDCPPLRLCQDSPPPLSMAVFLLPCQSLQDKESDVGSRHPQGVAVLSFEALSPRLDFRLLKKSQVPLPFMSCLF